jgi:hypothetical protein
LLGAVSRIFVDSVLGWYRRRMAIEGADSGQSGAVTVVQRVSADLKLHPHLHAVVLDGVFVAGAEEGQPVFPALPRISDVAVIALVRDPESIARYLRHLGLPTEEPSMAVPAGPARPAPAPRGFAAPVARPRATVLANPRPAPPLR